jgi:hypothetical protein
VFRRVFHVKADVYTTRSRYCCKQIVQDCLHFKT